MGRYFGTDGIRGTANVVLTPELCFRLGKSLKLLHTDCIYLGTDTRISASLIAASVSSGILSQGMDVYYAGIIPTPGLAYYCYQHQISAVMLTASHNPYQDNGIKVFPGGTKLLPSQETMIEDAIDQNSGTYTEQIGSVHNTTQVKQEYTSFLKGFNVHSKLKIGIDCANGATYQIAEDVYTDVTPNLLMTGNTPNGRNINLGVGATHMEHLKQFVISNHLDVGFSFDGDGDRIQAVDDDGTIYDGDQIITALAMDFFEKGQLRHNTVVFTKMTNLGILRYLDSQGIKTVLTDVGDKYVLEELTAHGYSLGGEISGHIILNDHLNSGDGLLASLFLVKLLEEKRTTLKEICRHWTLYPERLVNLKVKDKKIALHPLVQERVKELEKLWNGEGKILVRPSGTEPLVRVSVCTKDQGLVDHTIDEFVTLLQSLEA